MTAKSSLFAKYSTIIRQHGQPVLDDALLLGRSGSLATYYAPFDALFPNAKIVLVGISPGKAQMTDAICEAQRMLLSGASDQDALLAGKRMGAFGGPMRKNLIQILDRVGLNGFLKISSCADLFGKSSPLLMTTSILPFPVFVDGENYNGKPDPWKTPFLRQQVEQYFIPIVQAMQNAVFVPLGPIPSKVLVALSNSGALARGRVIDGLPHPSGANAERIKYFLGLKERAQLSEKVDPVKLDIALSAAREHVRQLTAVA